MVTQQTAAPITQRAEHLGAIWVRRSSWLSGQEILHTLLTQPGSDKWYLHVLAHSLAQPQHFLWMLDEPLQRGGTYLRTGCWRAAP